MRHWIVGAAASGVLCLAAQTALADGVDVAAPPLQPFTWTGFYVGAQIGGLANSSDIDDPLGPSIFGNPNIATGAFAGGQVGYNYQSGNLVYGIEADVAFPEVRGTGTCSAVSGAFVTSNCTVGIDAFGTLTGRLGVVLGPDGRSLVYGKAGAAWYTGSLDLATNDATLGAAGNPFTTGGDSTSRWGWTLGAGAEYALAGNWSVKAEYDYARFGNQSAGLLPSAFLDNAGDVVSAVPAREGQISSNLHTVKLGLNYRFGEPAPPVAEPVAGSLKDMPLPAYNPYSIELGARYWYSWGRFKYDLGLLKSRPTTSSSLISRLTYDNLDASTGEAVGRITAPWNLFAKGFIGGGSISGGHLNDEDFNITGDAAGTRVPYTNTISPNVGGNIPGYGIIDVGYDFWRTPSYRVGGYVGYNYYRETMGARGCAQIANQIGPCGLAESGPTLPGVHPGITEEAKWQALRIGAAVEFELLPGLRLTGDAAYLPAVVVDAVDNHFQGDNPQIASINPLDGHGVGTQLEVMLSYDITERWSLGVGARYWAMWTTDGSFRRTFDNEDPVTDTPPHQYLKLETERAGVLGQLMYRFD